MLPVYQDYNIECSRCHKPLVNGVRRSTKEGNYVAGYSLGYLCEKCMLEMTRK